MPIAALRSDSQWGQAELHLKDIFWQRQMDLIYLFKTWLSRMALGDTYLISQWTLSRMWEGSWWTFVFHGNSGYILQKENTLLQKFQNLYVGSFQKSKSVLPNYLVWEYRDPLEQHKLFHRLLCWRSWVPSHREHLRQWRWSAALIDNEFCSISSQAIYIRLSN